MAIEIVDLPINNGDFPVRYVKVYQRVIKVLDGCSGFIIVLSSTTPAIPHETTTPGVADGQPHLRWERHRHDAIESRTNKASTNGAQPQETSL